MKLSIIIPSRCDEYLQQTIDDLLAKSELGNQLEIIVVFDGIWSEKPLKVDPRVKIIHQGVSRICPGMREGINAGISLSMGEYVMKIDEHCMVDQGYDVKLIADCQPDWVVIPRRYRLDADTWSLSTDKRPPVDYMHIDFPYQRPKDKTCGLHGGIWNRPERSEIMIDDTPTMQGSCYFTSRKHWDNIVGKLSTEKYGPFTMEAQEISMPTWLSGGRVVVNKKTFYAHHHKGKKGKGYGFSNEQWRQHAEGNERGRLYAIDYWLNTKNYKYDWKWFINERFPGMPGWSLSWEDDIIRCKELEK